MHEIDFLPVEYRQRHQRRQAQPWHVVAVITVSALLATAVFAQYYRRHCSKETLNALLPAYEDAVKLNNHLAAVQKQLASASAEAELYTYLRHPWPRSQLLAAVVEPLPAGVTLQQVQILREPIRTAGGAESHLSQNKKAEEEKLKSLPPASRDLAKLKSQCDSTQTMLILQGTAQESSLLHEYLDKLDAADLFTRTDLDSVSSVGEGKEDAGVQFRAVLTVQPGYGQPGGPTGK